MKWEKGNIVLRGNWSDGKTFSISIENTYAVYLSPIDLQDLRDLLNEALAQPKEEVKKGCGECCAQYVDIWTCTEKNCPCHQPKEEKEEDTKKECEHKFEEKLRCDEPLTEPQIKMIRPEWEDIVKMPGYILCNCGTTLQTQQQNREHWQLGHFDKVDSEPQKPTKKPVCYCGHPKERHKLRLYGVYGNCWHCSCSMYNLN